MGSGRKRRKSKRFGLVPVRKKVRGYNRGGYFRRTKSGKLVYIPPHRVSPHWQRFYIRPEKTSALPRVGKAFGPEVRARPLEPILVNALAISFPQHALVIKSAYMLYKKSKKAIKLIEEFKKAHNKEAYLVRSVLKQEILAAENEIVGRGAKEGLRGISRSFARKLEQEGVLSEMLKTVNLPERLSGDLALFIGATLGDILVDICSGVENQVANHVLEGMV